MPRSTKPDPNRTKRACLTCREKKRKCPGEQPVCSLCERLEQRCSYPDHSINYNRNRGSTRPERGNSEGRLRRLELHIERIYGILNDTHPDFRQEARESPSVPNDAGPQRHLVSSAGATIDLTEGNASPSQADAWTRTWNLDQSIITRAVDVYISKIHCQPLPLFDILGLESDLTEWPQYLLLSLVVITSRLSPHVMPGWNAKQRRECHKRARREVMIKLAENDSHLEVLQTFCLLILEEIAEQDKHTVWLDIGIGSRLATTNNPLSLSRRTSEWARACWSLYVLDHIYNSGFSTIRAFPEEFNLCDYPPNHQLPRSRSLSITSDVQQDSQSAQSLSDVSTNIDACCVSLLSVWSHTMTFLRDMKDSNRSIIWSEHGGYQMVLTKLYQFELSLEQPHRLRNARVDGRSSLQLQAERGYWASWLTMQFLYHAIQAIINHPFLHIAERHKDHSAQSHSFLQHTIDQTLLHSSWVTKFVNFCEDKDFVINDPFIAHLVSIVSTGYLFFLNNSDSKIAGQAQRGFDTCQGFIERSAVVWTHLKNTLHKLGILKGSYSSQSPAYKTTLPPHLQASLLWSLFDYSLSTTPTPISSDATVEIDKDLTTQLLLSPDSARSSRDGHSRTREVTPSTDVTMDQATFQQSDTTPEALPKSTNIFDSFLDLDIYSLNLEGDSWIELGQL